MKRLFSYAATAVLAMLVGAGPGGGVAVSSTDALFRFDDLVGSAPNMPIRGVPSGGLPWVASGEARLDRDGELRVEVEGLLLTNTGNPALDGTTGPVRGVRASLTCEGAGVVATTAVAPLSAAGDAEIRDTITVPARCVGPIVLIRIGATTTASNLMGPWIAASGF